MKIEKLVKKFNHPDVQLVVSGWPTYAKATVDKPHSAEASRGKPEKGYHGDAAFTRETLLSLVKQKHMRFVVIAEVNPTSSYGLRGASHDNGPELVADGNILILRVIDHGKFHLYPTVLTWLNKFPAIRHVTVHSNFTYSGIKHFILLVPFLAIIRMTGRKLSLVSHNVLNSVDFLARQLDLKSLAFLPFFNQALKLYNIALGVVVNQLVVLDIQGHKILKKYISINKLIYIPHFVKPRSTSLSKIKAKHNLGIPLTTKVILSFGFISYYKGSDILARLYAKKYGKNSKYYLIFAGGASPSLADTPHYQTYYVKFKEFISSIKNIRLTGFLKEEILGQYFAAADLVVLPYRGLMGGSGAFSYTVGYKKPFVISSNMKNLLENPDIKNLLKREKINTTNLVFDLDEMGVQKIAKIVNKPYLMRKLTKVSNLIRKVRNLNEMTSYTYDKLYAQDYERAYSKDVKPSLALNRGVSI